MYPNEANSDERLIEHALRDHDRVATADTTAHIDAELIAMFAAGTLSEEEKNEVTEHLSTCSMCREAASLLVSLPSEDEFRPEPKRLGKNAVGIWQVMVALSILLMIGLVVWNSNPSPRVAEAVLNQEVRALLVRGDFTTALRKLKDASRQGVESDRLVALQVQAMLEVPDPVSLRASGQLSDLGYRIDGIGSRTIRQQDRAKQLQAQELLARLKSDDLEIRLNQAYLLVLLNENEEAIQRFGELAKNYPDDALVWLGLGIARYADQQLAEAEEAFVRSLQLDAKNNAAKINLAMTLTDQGKLKGALEMWKQVDLAPLPSQQQQEIQDQMDELR